MSTQHRELIREARNGLRRRGNLVNELADALESLLDGHHAPIGDEAAIRKNINEGLSMDLLAWADLLEEQGDAKASQGMRWLVHHGKEPGQVRGVYSWRQDDPKYAGSNASFSLPVDAHAIVQRDCPAGVSNRSGQFRSKDFALLAAARAVGEMLNPPPKPAEPASVAAQPAVSNLALRIMAYLDGPTVVGVGVSVREIREAMGVGLDEAFAAISELHDRGMVRMMNQDGDVEVA